MAFISLIPGSTVFKQKLQDRATSIASDAVTEKLSCFANPLCFQKDTVFPNASDGLASAKSGVNQGLVLSSGCRGHQIDNVFPLECSTPCALPLVMYPTRTHGNTLHEVDMCAAPVLNWEAYILDCNGAFYNHTNFLKKPSRRTRDARDEFVSEDEFSEQDDDAETEVMDVDDNLDDNEKRPLENQKLRTKEHQNDTKAPKLTGRYAYAKLRAKLINADKIVDIQETNSEKYKRIKKKMQFKGQKNVHENELDSLDFGGHFKTKFNKIPSSFIATFINQPKLKVEGTWNHLYGGLNGACCVTQTRLSKNSKSLNVFVGKGSQLRMVKLQETSHSLQSNKLISVWEEFISCLPKSSNPINTDPFNDLVLQIVPGIRDEIIGVRRGRSIGIYSIEEESPYLLETVSNSCFFQHEGKSKSVENPYLLGLDFNPTYNPEIITVDENLVIRINDVTIGATQVVCKLPMQISTPHSLKDYPPLKLNEAVGVSFTNFGERFYAWGQSVVRLGDRRNMGKSSDCLVNLFDLQNHIYSLSTSDQHYFHEKHPKVNEYISCVQRSKHDPYYYVGTTSSIYLMDYRVPSRPVIKVSHGLQSAVTYLDISNDENFEILIGGSQRLPETVCMITDRAHVNCIDRPGCTQTNPVLNCYPRALSNSREFFETSTKSGFHFSHPADHDMVKHHHNAWSTGLASWHIPSTDPKVPHGVMVVSSNNFGDIFLQEWIQGPIPSHKKFKPKDKKFEAFMLDWQKTMVPSVSLKDTPQPSKNKWKSLNCSILMGHLSGEIKRLTNVRENSFDCFKPKQVQYMTQISKSVPMDELLCSLQRYKGDKVTGMLNVWRDNPLVTEDEDDTTNVNELEGVQIKEETLSESYSSPSSSNSSVQLWFDEDDTSNQENRIYTTEVLENEISDVEPMIQSQTNLRNDDAGNNTDFAGFNHSESITNDPLAHPSEVNIQECRSMSSRDGLPSFHVTEGKDLLTMGDSSMSHRQVFSQDDYAGTDEILEDFNRETFPSSSHSEQPYSIPSQSSKSRNSGVSSISWKKSKSKRSGF